MTDTSGRPGSSSSGSAGLQSFLASRLPQRLASRGSTLYALTWRERATPSGLRICQLRAWAPRTSGRGSGSSAWPTPNATGGERGGSLGHLDGRRSNLIDAVLLAGWPTATAIDSRSSGVRDYPPTPTHHSGTTLTDAARLTGWPTATTTDYKHVSADGQRRGHLGSVARLVSPWATPASREAGGTPEQFLARKSKAVASGKQLGVSLTSLSLQAQLADPGETSSGSTAGTAGTGQLAAEFSRWLMAYPPGWDLAAPWRASRGRRGSGATATRSSRRSRRSSSQ